MCPPLLQADEGGCVVRRTAVRPYDPLPRGNCAGRTAVRPYTPHSVGEGLGVRANTSERQHRDRLGDWYNNDDLTTP